MWMTVIFSKTSEEHLRHINLIFNKVTTAGFTINALKCKYCQPQMNFLGNVIWVEAISADPQRITAVLRSPAPRNKKQLRQFLGTWGFHNKFVINYADFVAPLSPMLKKVSNGNGQLSYSRRLKNYVNSLLTASTWDKSHKRYSELSGRHNQPQPCRTDTGTNQAVNKT